MALFSFGKAKKVKRTDSGTQTVEDIASVKVLGSGCKACHGLYESTKKAVGNLDLSVEVEYITDMEKVMKYGVMHLPVLVVDERVVSAGKLLKTADIEEILKGELL